MKGAYVTLFNVFIVVEISMAAIDLDCATDDECASVPNAICVSDKCGCHPAYKLVAADSCAAKGLGDICSTTPDCTAVNNSMCNNNTSQCECSPNFVAVATDACREVGTENEEIETDKGLGDTCTVHNHCSGVDHSACTDGICKCANGYKEYGIVCVIDSPCRSALECTEHLANSKCDTKCVCDANFTVEENVCKVGADMGICSNASDCVKNATCDDNNECKCEPDFRVNNGRCVASGAGTTSLKLITDIVLVAIIVVSLLKLF